MAATPSTSLYELIKSLTKSEKRYFKIFSSKHTIGEENNYITLFDYLDNQNGYDETKLFEDFKGQAFLNKFSITKKRLQENILRSLDSYHSNSSIDAQLYRMMHYAEILYDKSLYKQCKKYLQSAEKLAEKHAKYHILLEVNQKMKRLLENTGYAGSDQAFLDAMQTKDNELSEVIRGYNNLWHIKSSLMMHLNRNGVARNQEERKIYDELIHPLSHCQYAVAFDSVFLVNQIQAAYYFGTLDFQKSEQYIAANITLYKENAERLKEEVNIYFSLISNGIYLNHHLGDYSRVDELLNELKTISKESGKNLSEDLNIKLFSSINSTRLMLYNERGEFTEAIQTVPLIEEAYRLYGSKIAPARRAYLNYNIAVAYFGEGAYTQSLKWINTILNDKDLDEKLDIYCFSQLLNLILHFELDNRELLPYAIKNTQRYLKSRNRVYKFEEIFLKYLNKLSRTISPLDQMDLLENVITEIQPLTEDPFERSVFDSFKFLLWAKSKLLKRPFAELVHTAYSERSK